MSLHVYQSIKSVYLLGYVRVNGRHIAVKFDGGQKSPKQENGKYSTSDPDIQKALEASPEYGRKWVRIVPRHVDEVKEEPTPEKVTKASPQAVPEPVATVPEPQKTIISGITNAQQAKNYLLAQNFEGVTFRSIMNKAQIAEAAKKFNVVFPDWQYGEV